MRLNVLSVGHGEASSDRFGARGASAEAGASATDIQQLRAAQAVLPLKRNGKKTLPQMLAAELKPEVVDQRAVRLCFQDEARFGRMVRFRRGWAPRPLRPKVLNGYEREFTYVEGAVSPLDGQLDWSLSSKMNTPEMNAFLNQVSVAHPQEHLWDDWREKAFPNRVSANMEQVLSGLKQELGAFATDPKRVRNLTAWPW